MVDVVDHGRVLVDREMIFGPAWERPLRGGGALLVVPNDLHLP
jgi:hypothetical protein